MPPKFRDTKNWPLKIAMPLLLLGIALFFPACSKDQETAFAKQVAYAKQKNLPPPPLVPDYGDDAFQNSDAFAENRSKDVWQKGLREKYNADLKKWTDDISQKMAPSTPVTTDLTGTTTGNDAAARLSSQGHQPPSVAPTMPTTPHHKE